MKASYHFRFIDEARKSGWSDLTFKFLGNGSVIITDNITGGSVSPRELKGAALDFYNRKRIYLIKTDLEEKRLKYA